MSTIRKAVQSVPRPTFTWGEGEGTMTISKVELVEGEWREYDLVAEFYGESQGALRDVCIDALKRSGWSWVPPKEIE